MSIFLSILLLLPAAIHALASRDQQQCLWVPLSGETALEAACALGVGVEAIQKKNPGFDNPNFVFEGRTYTVPCVRSITKPATWSHEPPSTFFLKLNGFTGVQSDASTSTEESVTGTSTPSLLDSSLASATSVPGSSTLTKSDTWTTPGLLVVTVVSALESLSTTVTPRAPEATSISSPEKSFS